MSTYLGPHQSYSKRQINSLVLILRQCVFIVLSMTGEWADEDYSIACMHAVDYRVVGGYNLSAVNFQLQLYQHHVASGLKVNFCRI